MRVLLIKLTSMGDLIHALPALTDAQQAIGDLSIDWVVDEAFHEVALWHPSVNKVVKSAHRRWKKDIIGSWRSGELQHFYRQLHQQQYDVVVDAQNNIKSAITTRLASGKAHGLDKHSVRERYAHLAYKYRHPVSKHLHAVQRVRQLFSQVFNYPLPAADPEYSIQRQLLRPPAIDLPDNYVVFVHLASWDTKLWPTDNWSELIKLALDAGYEVVMPSGSEQELQRGRQLADNQPRVHALPALSLSEVAWIINNAKGAVSCDTGLCHMAAALDIPTVSFYGPTDVKLIGAAGKHQSHIIADSFACAPCYQKMCTFNGYKSAEAVCMRNMLPRQVWQELEHLLG